MGNGSASSSTVKVGRIISALRSGKRSRRWLMLKRRPSPPTATRPLSARVRVRPSGAMTTQWSGFQALASATSSGAATPWPDGARISACGIDTRVRNGQPVVVTGAWVMVQPSCRRTSTWAASRVSVWSVSQNHQPVQTASSRPMMTKGVARPRRGWRGVLSVIGAPAGCSDMRPDFRAQVARSAVAPLDHFCFRSTRPESKKWSRIMLERNLSLGGLRPPRPISL